MITELNQHKQIMIKVNAEVDEGVAPIVRVLNEINGIVTLDSCQQGIYGEAYVFFIYRKDWQELGLLLNEMATILRENGICCECVLRMEWVGSNDHPRAKLSCGAGHVGDIADIIRQSVAKINCRMSELIHDKCYTGLRN